MVLRLPDSKTGAKEIPVGGAAQLVLKNIDRTTSPWVIPGRDPRAALVNLNKAWQRIRKHAEIEDVRKTALAGDTGGGMIRCHG